MSQLWTPGMAGPLEELVKRIHRRIDAFREQHGVAQVSVSVELVDGSLHRLASLSPGAGLRLPDALPALRRGRAGGADRAARRSPRDPARRRRAAAEARVLRCCGVVRGHSSRLRDRRSTTPHAAALREQALSLHLCRLCADHSTGGAAITRETAPSPRTAWGRAPAARARLRAPRSRSRPCRRPRTPRAAPP